MQCQIASSDAGTSGAQITVVSVSELSTPILTFSSATWEGQSVQVSEIDLNWLNKATVVTSQSMLTSKEIQAPVRYPLSSDYIGLLRAVQQHLYMREAAPCKRPRVASPCPHGKCSRVDKSL